MTPDDLTPVQVQLLLDLADADLAEWRANARVLVHRAGYQDNFQESVLVQEAMMAGIAHAQIRQRWIDMKAALR